MTLTEPLQETVEAMRLAAAASTGRRVLYPTVAAQIADALVAEERSRIRNELLRLDEMDGGTPDWYGALAAAVAIVDAEA